MYIRQASDMLATSSFLVAAPCTLLPDFRVTIAKQITFSCRFSCTKT